MQSAKSRDDKEMDKGRSEAGRTEGGDRAEKNHLKRHSNGMKKFEFKSYLRKKVIRGSSEFQSYFCFAQGTKKLKLVDMKKFTNHLMMVVVFFAITIPLSAQLTVVGHITAEVVSSLTAQETSQLSFGQFSTLATGGQITLTPKGTRLSNGTVNALAGMHNSGSFSITGEPNASITVQLPTEPATLTNAANSGTLLVTNWMSDLPQLNNVIIPRSGIQQVNVGATLLVGIAKNSPVGKYSGTYNITFNYN